MAIAAEEIVTRLSLVGRATYSAEMKKAEMDTRSLAARTKEAGATAKAADKQWGFFRSSLQNVAHWGKIAAGVVLSLTVAVGYFGTKLVEEASNAYETQQKFDKVFEGMGGSAQKFVDDTFAKFGYSRKELEDAASIFAIFAKSAGVAEPQVTAFSTSLVQAGIDMASFYNKDPQVVFNALSSGLAGNIRPLRAYGIFISQSMVKARAEQKGLVGDLTDAQKVLIRHELILEQIGDAHHDLARTSQGLQNQLRGLRGRAEQLAITFGQFMLPYAIALVHGLNDQLGPAISRIATMVPRLGDFSITTAVHFQWMGRAAMFFADGVEAFVNGGGEGFLAWLDQVLNTGDFVQTFFHTTAVILGLWWQIFTTGIIPAWKEWAPLISLVNIPLQMLAALLGFLANNMKLTTVLIHIAIGVWLAWKVVTTASAIAMFFYRGALLATRIPQIVATRLSWSYIAGLNAQTTATTGATAATTELGVATWSAALPVIALIALFAAVAIATYLVLDNFETLSDGAVEFFGAIEDAGVSVWMTLYGWGESFAGTVKAVFNQVTDWIETAVNIGIIGINQLIDAANYIPGVHIDNIDEIELPRLHSGGRVERPGLVNMRPDEEAVFLPGGATVVPLAPLERMRSETEMRPMLVQLIMPDRKVLAEVMVDGNADREARR